jgi:hypothetical protein
MIATDLCFISNFNPNPEIEIHDCAPSSHPRASRKIIAEPCATQIFTNLLNTSIADSQRILFRDLGSNIQLSNILRYDMVKQARDRLAFWPSQKTIDYHKE